MVTGKDGKLQPTRVVIRSREHFKGDILAECYQVIKEPINLEELLGCLGEEQGISRVLIVNIPVHKDNVDQIINFFQDIKSRLV